MSNMFSEANKINCVLIPHPQSSGAAAAPLSAVYETDTVNMENYKKCTFIYQLGQTTGIVTHDLIPMCGDAATSGTGAVTPITGYHYRTQGITSVTPYTSDTPSALTAGTSAGVTTTTDGVGGLYIIEIDSSEVVATASTAYFVKLYIVSTTAADAPRDSACVAILSEPRYPQDILASVIS